MNPSFSKQFQQWLFFLGTFLSGFASLVYQVVWQRYLSILIGSEAKSSAIVVSIFLVGLALGYFFFGRLMEKSWSRRFSLKFYGYVELATAIYAISFPLMFPLFKSISFSGSNNILFDIFVVGLCLLFPTFLMGGSIPILTKVLPESPEEVNHTHARVYGWNTLGACLGVLIGGFYLIPQHGLPISMMIAGSINVLLSFIFLGNRLEGEAHQTQSVRALPNKLQSWQVYLLVFVVGLVTISFEVVLMRLVGLSIGSSNLVFPTVLSIFIFGLGFGSLRLPTLKNSHGLYRRMVLILSLWLGVFLCIPYWGFWAAHIKISMAMIESNFYVYNVLVLLMLSLFIFPPVYFMGQILPLAYSLLDKSGKDYGKKCGFLYSSNTLGTALGGVLLGYLFLYLFDLDAIFRINVLLLGAITLYLCFVEKNRLNFAFCSVLTLLIFIPQWNRSGHHMGYFRDTTPGDQFFKGLFYLPDFMGDPVLHYSDGPNSSITITGYGPEIGGATQKMMEDLGLTQNVSVLVNGKSDGDIMGDFSNMYLTGAIPYLLTGKEKDLNVAMIGYGTGLSLGTLEQSKDISKIDLIEISSELLKVRDKTKGSNFVADQGPKTTYINNDAFRFFTRSKKTYDLIVTEPSNPWVTGVENIFTEDFFNLAQSKLSDKGVLGVWFQRYNSHVDIVAGILAALTRVFPHYHVYQIGSGDSLILASKSEITGPYLDRRTKESFHRKVLSALRMDGPNDIQNLLTFSEIEMKWASLKNKLGQHSLEFPKLSDLANKYRFFHNRAEIDSLVEDELRFLLRTRQLEFRNSFQNSLENITRLKECPQVHGFQFYCQKMKALVERLMRYSEKSQGFTEQRLGDYLALRSMGLVSEDSPLIEEALREIPNRMELNPLQAPPWVGPTFLTGLLEGYSLSELKAVAGYETWPTRWQEKQGPRLKASASRALKLRELAQELLEKRGLSGGSSNNP